MTIENLCVLFDGNTVVDKKNQLDNEYIASSNIIYSDGKFSTKIDSSGYIHINNISDTTNYLIYIDQNGDIFLVIYKYIAETKFKEIIDKLNSIRDQTGMRKHSLLNRTEDGMALDDMADLKDINDLHCESCNDKMEIVKIYKNGDMIAICNKCNIKYALKPSKYYVLAAKTKIYSSNKYSIKGGYSNNE
jgi:hypothetical protein